MSVTQAQIEQIQLDTLRFLTGSAALVATAINSGGSLTLASYQAQVCTASGTVQGTVPALVVSNYMEGVVPATAVLDSRASFCRAQYAAYVAAGSGFPEIGPYEALGSVYYVEAVFIAKVNGKTTAQVWQDAYTAGFNVTMSSAQIAHFDAQYSYFYGLYTGAGLSATDADLKAKAAVVGQILGYSGAYTPAAGGGQQYTKAQTWLAAASTGSPSYGTAL